MSQLLSKMSAKAIVGAIKPLLPRDAEKNIIKDQIVMLYTVFGIARGVKKGESTFGPWVSFSGSFEAVDTNGEVYNSSNLFLPEVAENLLLPVVMDEKNESGVAFSFAIGAKASDSSVGYEYVVKTLQELAADDPLAAMRAKLADKLPKPVAPKVIESAAAAETAKETASAETAKETALAEPVKKAAASEPEKQSTGSGSKRRAA